MVVFDMAGTVVDEQNVVYKTLHQALMEAGCAVTLEEVLRIGAGKEKKQAVLDLLHSQAADAAMAEVVFQRFLALLDLAYQDLIVLPQRGAEETFDYLHRKGVFVVLNTGYNQATARQLIKKLGWQEGREFDLLVTASDVASSRPHPDMIQLAQQHFGLENPRSVAKVGDSIIDIEEGRNAGCGLVVGITTGAHTHDQLSSAHPDHIIDQLDALRDWIK